jgi:hypothetical protein
MAGSGLCAATASAGSFVCMMFPYRVASLREAFAQYRHASFCIIFEIIQKIEAPRQCDMLHFFGTSDFKYDINIFF